MAKPIMCEKQNIGLFYAVQVQQTNIPNPYTQSLSSIWSYTLILFSQWRAWNSLNNFNYVVVSMLLLFVN